MTYRDVATFLNVAGPRLEKPDQSKFSYALKKMVKQCSALWATYLELVEDLDIEHCAVDKAGVILKDEKGNFSFTKDGLRQRNAARKTLFESAIVVTPFLAAGVPLDLTDAEREAFAGFVLPAIIEDSFDAAEKLDRAAEQPALREAAKPRRVHA